MIDERKILLTINLEGGLTQVSKIIRDKETNIHSRKHFKVASIAKQKITLGEVFIENATSMEGRPSVRDNFNIYAHWKKMKPKERLEFHLKDLVSSIAGIKHPLANRDYTYKMI